MRGDVNVSDVEQELAMAVGLLVLTDASLHEAARQAGVSRRELEACLRTNSLADRIDVTVDTDVKDEIDKVFEDRLA